MSHALLLRLFLSPSFFSVHVALQYLMLYADNIGITYYLTRRLKELDTQELREVWGFVWYLPVFIVSENHINSFTSHLLVTRPSKSRALECFVVDISQQSTHIAMIVRRQQPRSSKLTADSCGDPLVYASFFARSFLIA
jgi:phosphatidylinositol 4-kinase